MTVLQITDMRRILLSVSLSATNFFLFYSYQKNFVVIADSHRPYGLCGSTVALVLMMLLDEILMSLCVKAVSFVDREKPQPLK